MATNTIGDAISRIRNQIKAVKQDAFITDRLIYSFIVKHSKWLLKREDGKNKLMGFSSEVQTLDYVPLIEVDKVEAKCSGISSGCTIKRTEEKLPTIFEGYYGLLIRDVTSIDSSVSLQETTPNGYINISKSSNFKYNTTKYFWSLNEYFYFPNLDWDAVRVEGWFEEDISSFNCEGDDEEVKCKARYDQSLNIPDFLLGELESHVFKDLAGGIQIPQDVSIDKQSITR